MNSNLNGSAARCAERLAFPSCGSPNGATPASLARAQPDRIRARFGKAEPYRTSGCEAELMRIIAGKYRGRRLKTPASAQTRPTSDRLRETLFNVLAPRIKGARFLDLCAGTGAVGIEALSRGAEHVTFVDQSRKMCSLIEANTSALGIDEKEFELVNADASAYLRRHAKKVREPFDIIFFDPPYATDYEAVLNLLADGTQQLLSDDSLVIVEHHKKKDLPDEFGSLKRYRTLKQGDSVLSFFKPAA